MSQDTSPSGTSAPLAAFCLLFAGLVFISFINLLNFAWRLQTETQVVPASIIQVVHDKQSSPKDGVECVSAVEYSFTIQDKTYTNHSDFIFWHNEIPRGPIEVRYFPQDPEISVVNDPRSFQYHVAEASFRLTVTLFLLLVAAVVWPTQRENW